ARALWFAAPELPEACLPVMEALAAADRLSTDDVWERVRRQLEAKKLGQARFAGQFLPVVQRPDARALDVAADQPARFLERLPAGFSSTRPQREAALFAVQRLARQDVETARDHWRRIEARFPDAERAYGWALLGWQGAQRHHPEAFAWYEKAGGLPLPEELHAWRVRAALRNQDWAGVRRSIEQMTASQSAEPTWTYWYARSLSAQGQREEARALFQRIAGQASFYGNLADEELGRAISVPPRALPPSREEMAAAAATPGLRRALALFRLDMRVEAVKEWNWTLRGMDDRQLLAAAELARGQDIYDRAINTADRTQAQHDFGLRYLAPFREKVEPKARELALDNGWVYGLMRQESRFILQARSSAGAQGLMQLMPATAKWVARKIGLAGFQPGRVTDMDTNVTLGTHYMKMVLESLDNHPVLASAAYNAGPGRARKWRAARPLEGAIYAETIPFNETRDYVKKVMSNAVYYAALFEERPQSLKTRLGIIQPGRGGEPGEDLP
ncbi:MAG TPA: transglycosylase SLT domain-containing protein, partial [Rhodocyclaceae bacterium]|nr:transglycosylase SLT domain-containing protein [Rhodocyclaceae bacterium]